LLKYTHGLFVASLSHQAFRAGVGSAEVGGFSLKEKNWRQYLNNTPSQNLQVLMENVHWIFFEDAACKKTDQRIH
jgi:hypothetical protein